MAIINHTIIKNRARPAFATTATVQFLCLIISPAFPDRSSPNLVCLLMDTEAIRVGKLRPQGMFGASAVHQ